MPAADRAVMFALINSPKLLNLLAPLMPNGTAFMNTQLFFGPWDPDKKNYWHRGIQYTGMSVAEQQAEMAVVNVIHCRIALVDEPGLELVPDTHKCWDVDEEEDCMPNQLELKNLDPASPLAVAANAKLSQKIS